MGTMILIGIAIASVAALFIPEKEEVDNDIDTISKMENM